MDLEEILGKAREALWSGLLTTEGHIRAAVIAPVLRGLGWDDFDPRQWLVQYAIEGYSIDDALFDGTGQPLVFIEAKRHGYLSPQLEERLFRHATDNGIPMLVLTDGNTWDMYLSLAAGKPSNRRFARLVISDSDDLTELAEDFWAFLSRDAIWSGDAQWRSEVRLKEVKDRELGRGGLEGAWRTLLSGPDEMLRELLVEQVEQDVGSRPRRRDVDDFLRQKIASATESESGAGLAAQLTAVQTSTNPSSEGKPRLDAKVKTRPRPTGRMTKQNGSLRGFWLKGSRYVCESDADTILRFAAVLQGLDSSFLKRLSENRPHAEQTFPRVVQDGHPAFDTNPAHFIYKQIYDCPGWWLNTRLSTTDTIRRMRDMSDTAGIDFGRDVTLLREADRLAEHQRRKRHRLW